MNSHKVPINQKQIVVVSRRCGAIPTLQPYGLVAGDDCPHHRVTQVISSPDAGREILPNKGLGFLPAEPCATPSPPPPPRSLPVAGGPWDNSVGSSEGPSVARHVTGGLSMDTPKVQKFLRKVGLGKDDLYFWKQMGKAVICTYTIFGLAWLWNETSPLGWWTLKPRPKEEKEMAHLYERRRFPYPGDKEAVEEFIASGGAIGTTIGPKGFIDSGQDSDNFQKQLQSKKFEQEAQKMWFRMRNEVIQELQEKGFDVE